MNSPIAEDFYDALMAMQQVAMQEIEADHGVEGANKDATSVLAEQVFAFLDNHPGTYDDAFEPLEQLAA